jgi:DNA adenine methylase
MPKKEARALADVSVAKPSLKWVGGKTVLLPEILPRLPAKIKTYYEPFVGGGAVFFALAAEERFDHAMLSDANAELVNVYDVIQTAPERLMDLLRTLRVTEEEFARIRADDSEKHTRVYRAARTIYLNKTCFNGLYRVNKSGKFNTPWGKRESATLFVEENIRACARAFECASLNTCDFEVSASGAKRGDAVYFDSPYVPVSETANFTGYTAGGFGEIDQIRLRDLAMTLDARGVHVLLSNADTPLVRELYSGFLVESVQAPRRVNSKGGKRGNVGELLISGRSAK